MTIAAPDTPQAMANLLADKDQFKAFVDQEGSVENAFKAYSDATNQRDETLLEQVRIESERVLRNWLKEHGQPENRLNLDPLSSPAATQEAVRTGLYNKSAIGAVLDQEFENSADFFKSIWHNTDRDAELSAKLNRVRNAFSSNIPSEGGFLIPERLRADLLRVALESSIVRPRARIVPMDSLRVPFPAIDETSRATSVFGGITAFWTEEAAALQESQAQFGRIVLDAKKLTAYTEVPNELLSDSAISFQAFIDQIFPEALAFFEDRAFFDGTGTGEPEGFLNAPGAITVNRNTTGANIEFVDVVNMFSRMLPQSINRAVWTASIDTFPQLAQMAVTRGTDGIASPAVWLSSGQAIEAPPVTILGRPVIFTEKSPGLGNEGDLAFVDFGFYLVGDRQAMTATSSTHFKFQNDLTAFRIIERVDGKPWLRSAITPANGGSTLSAYVKLGG